MNGAEALIQTLSECGVEVCFANPGTSEMQLVAAIGQQEGMRAILALFEGVVTGAADGYGRMTDKPAATLLHLGPGLANGLANLHNAKRARTPLINIVGDHAVDHLKYNAPLTSDVVGVATPMSNWVRTSTSPSDLSVAGAEAVAVSQTYPGQIATVIAPGDHAWTDGAEVSGRRETPDVPQVKDSEITEAAAVMSKLGQAALFLGSRALREDALFHAGRIAAATGARIICESLPARLQRGVGRVPVERLPYFGEMAVEHLASFQQIVFVGSEPPVSFFAYPDKPGWLSPEGAELVELADAYTDAEDTLRRLADALSAPESPANVQQAATHSFEDGKLTTESAGIITALLLPENAIVSDEACTSGGPFYKYMASAAKHDWLTLTGGAIGQGLPLAAGAAVACPDRKVIALQADGSGMYTNQALWTMARENLDVVTIIMKNNSYAILNIELGRVGVTNAGEKALSLLDLTNPTLDWVSLSEGMGVPATRAETAPQFYDALAAALANTGPHLIEAVLT
ncbi:MAG: acetolactate synthase large subunit [Sphingomonadales bacterium]|nr:acetolactate synthase large subunit [Sphingomonadales bacterium]